MFGINDNDDKNDQGDDTTGAMTMPKPLVDDDDKSGVNPISGNETLGPPVTSGMPQIVTENSPLNTSASGKRKLLMDDSSSMPLSSATTMPDPVMPTDDKTEKTKKKSDEKPAKDSDKPSKDDEPVSVPTLPGNIAPSDLLSIKKEALQDLLPLVDKLDQPPAEKFKTYMMLIQASDNAELVKPAFEAANQISDEKAKAQALLDVVNEINYFTQAKD